MTNKDNTELTQKVINKLRELSAGKTPVTPHGLADAILHERIANPNKTIINMMRAEVFSIIKVYFPYAKADTPITLGEGGIPKPQERVTVKVIDKDTLIIELVKFINSKNMQGEMPEYLMNTVRAYLERYAKDAN